MSARATRSLSRWLWGAGTFLLAFAATAILLGAFAINELTTARQAGITYVQPAARAAQTLTTALLTGPPQTRVPWPW